MNAPVSQATLAAAHPITLEAVQQFLFKEARCLDESRFDDWLALYAADATYWIPSARDQTDPLNVPSIIYENRDVLEMRVRRLASPRTYAAAPKPYTTHLIGNVAIDEISSSGDECTVYSVVHMHEYRDEQRRLLSGRVKHVLRRTGDSFLIASKRVDKVDCDSVQSTFMIPF